MDISALANSANSTVISLARIMSTRSIAFGSNERSKAQTLKDMQRKLWQAVLSSAEITNICRDPRREPAWDTETLDARIGNAFFIEDNSDKNNGIALIGRIPVLTSESAEQLSTTSTDDKVLLCAAILIECAYIFKTISTSHISLDVLCSMFQYSAGGLTTVEITKRVWELNGTVDRSKSSADQLSAQVKKSVANFLTEEQDKLAAYKRSLSEEVKVRSASELWSERAFWHRAVASISLVAFFGLISFGLWYLAANANWIIGLLPRDKDGHIEYVSIALLAIPAIGFGWSLRVLTRFIHTNSILGDDSRQRQAMTRTYLALVADKDSEVTDKDRLVMLNAIFRSLPGTQVDEVAPPTVIDLLKKEA